MLTYLLLMHPGYATTAMLLLTYCYAMNAFYGVYRLLSPRFSVPDPLCSWIQKQQDRTNIHRYLRAL